MKEIKMKTLWVIDVYYNIQSVEILVQANTFKYKKDALNYATQFSKFEILKRKVLTNKY